MVRWLRILAVLITLATPTTTAKSDTSDPQPRVLRRPIVPGRIVVLNVGLHFTTAIRVPETVSSVVVGDPARFKVEHYEKEPRLVFVKPISAGAAQSNLLVSTVAGRSVSLLVRSEETQTEHAASDDSTRPVHLVLDLLPEKGFLIEESSPASLLVAETVRLERPNRNIPWDEPLIRTKTRIDRLLESQQVTQLPSLRGNPLGVGIGQIYQNGQQTFVLFSVVNHGKQAIELLPPQVQLAGTRSKGRGSVEQIPVREYRLTSRRLRPSERADGVVTFERPTFKQSHESYFLQLAESASVDRPSLAPIDPGRSQILSSEEEP
jgi:hypothetical protein